jgi:hypothetical protein
MPNTEPTKQADTEETMVVVDSHGVKLGACVWHQREDGWRFIPAVTSRKASRRVWPSATECLPKWAFDLSEEMLTSSEYQARRRQHQ